MERKIMITAIDGKHFHGSDYFNIVNEVNAYEADLKLKKEKEEAEQKAREEKQKRLQQYKEKKLKEINEIVKSLNDMMREYENETGMKLYYGYNYCGGDFSVKETTNTIDMAWDNLVEDIIKVVSKA